MQHPQRRALCDREADIHHPPRPEPPQLCPAPQRGRWGQYHAQEGPDPGTCERPPASVPVCKPPPPPPTPRPLPPLSNTDMMGVGQWSMGLGAGGGWGLGCELLMMLETASMVRRCRGAGL